MRNDTELLKELLGFFSTVIENDLEWLYNETVEGMREVCEDSTLVDELLQRHSDFYGAVNNDLTTAAKSSHDGTLLDSNVS